MAVDFEALLTQLPPTWCSWYDALRRLAAMRAADLDGRMKLKPYLRDSIINDLTDGASFRHVAKKYGVSSRQLKNYADRYPADDNHKF